MTTDEIQNIIDKTGKPLAYIEGFAYFHGRKFIVTPHALIPRPETEEIINVAKILQPKTILDIGTGSGCIAITLALQLPEAQIVATDISPEALQLAEQNAKHFKTTNITFIESDLCANLAKNQKFDLICANLPYVDKSWPWLDKTALSHEPAQALYAPSKGLKFIKKLIEQAPHHLTKNGTLVLEHDPIQLSAISAFARKHSLNPTPHTSYVTSFNS
jgi:release factor glutamine methyltransferase